MKKNVKVIVKFEVIARVPDSWDQVEVIDRINEAIAIEVDSEDAKVSFKEVDIQDIDIEEV